MLSKKVRVALTIAVAVISVLGCGLLGVFLGYNYVLSQTDRFNALEQAIEDGKLVITEETPGAIMMIIETGSDTGEIAAKLKEMKLIDNELFFTVMSWNHLSFPESNSIFLSAILLI